MKGLSPVAPSPHFFRQTVGWSEDKRIPLAEELDRSLGFAAAHVAFKVAQAVPRQMVVVARRGAGSEVLFNLDVVKLGEVGSMLHGHMDLLALFTPLCWGDRGKVLYLE